MNTTEIAAGRINAPAKSGATVSRRAVLTAAAAGGAGVAAARLLGLSSQGEFAPVPLTGTLGNKIGVDWVSPLGNDAARVAQLLRRFTFGAQPDELERAQSEGYAKTLEGILETKPADPPPLAGADNASQAKPLNLGALQQWWVDWMLATPTPFIERMTLFWHGHFTSDFRKVGLQDPFVYWQNLTWRKYALSDLRSFLYQVTIDPAMLRYLDLGTSTGRNPNENYSRELMELFAMGVGNFAEDDVRAGAKALAGWREPRTQAMIDAQIQRAILNGGKAPAPLPKADVVSTAILDKNRGFLGRVTFLGVTNAFDTDKVIDAILAQESTAPHITRKLVTHFVTPNPSDEYVARLADGFRRSKYDLKSLLRSMLLSPEANAPDTYRTLVKSPTEFMVHTAKILGGQQQLSRLILGSGGGMGQALFDPPDVGGWPQNESWISSNTMLARANFVTAAIGTLKTLPPADKAHAQHLDSVLSEKTLKLLNQAGDDRYRWSVILASAEFQLK